MSCLRSEVGTFESWASYRSNEPANCVWGMKTISIGTRFISNQFYYYDSAKAVYCSMMDDTCDKTGIYTEYLEKLMKWRHKVWKRGSYTEQKAIDVGLFGAKRDWCNLFDSPF